MANRTIIKNAKIWTSNRKAPWAEEIVLCDDVIEQVGPAGSCALTNRARVIDAEGKMIVPAFLDSHLHISTTALSLQLLWFQQVQFKTFEELLEVVRRYADEHPKEEVPFINSYSCPSACMEQEGVNRYLIDQYVSDRPVLVMDVNFHRCVVNSKMLELMGIDQTTPYDPDSPMNYERFEDGTPNGIIYEHVHEFNHDIDRMYENMGWWPKKEDDPALINSFMQRMSDYGICGVHEGYTETDLVLKALSKLEEEGKLKQYIQCMPLMKDYSHLEETIETAHCWQEQYGNDHLSVHSVKVFIDGTLEIGTFASLNPFPGQPGNYGTLNISEDELVHSFCRFNQENLDTQLHLVGDRAFRIVLNAVERAQKAEHEAGREFTSKVVLMHCELTHPDDRKRPAQLGVIINVNPGWCGGMFGDGAQRYMTQEQFDSLYSFTEMIESGATVCFSSDITDEGGFAIADPFYGIEVAHRRIDEKYVGTEQRSPASECIDLESLLYGFTINNAIEMRLENKTGSLEKGKKANLCILSDNLFTVLENRIKDIKVQMYMFEGEVIRGSL